MKTRFEMAFKVTFSAIIGGAAMMGTRSILSAALLAGLAAVMTTNLSVAQDLGPAREADKPVKIVAFGDSLTAGYMLEPSAALPAQLEATLKERGYSVVIENSGVSGDTTAAGLARLDWAIAPDTDAVIVELGANDALRGIDPAITRSNLDQILETSASVLSRFIDGSNASSAEANTPSQGAATMCRGRPSNTITCPSRNATNALF